MTTCLMCKVDKSDAAEDTEYHDIDTGESLCSACREWLRKWKTERNIVLLLDKSLPLEQRQDIARRWHEHFGDVETDGPPMTENAETGPDGEVGEELLEDPAP